MSQSKKIRLKEHIKNICDWADSKGLTENGTMDAQFEKIYEEITELREALKNQNLLEIKDAIGDIFITLVVAKQMEIKNCECVVRAFYDYRIDKDVKVSDDDINKFLDDDFNKLKFIRNNSDYVSNKIVNSIVGTLYIASKSYDMEFLECVAHSYEIISKRTGKIINGSFVKDGK